MNFVIFFVLFSNYVPCLDATSTVLFELAFSRSMVYVVGIMVSVVSFRQKMVVTGKSILSTIKLQNSFRPRANGLARKL